MLRLRSVPASAHDGTPLSMTTIFSGGQTRRIIFAVALAAIPATASACAVCMGDPNSYLANATNSTIWMLLGMVGFIFLSTGATAFYLWRRSKAEIPPHIELVEKLNEESDED